jgi:ribonuclease HI
MKIDIYSDGSGQTSNTDGGYGWVMIVDGVKHSEGSGHLSNATNNDCELQGAIEGLIAVFKFAYPPIDIYCVPRPDPVEITPPEVTLVSDSQIVLGWASGQYRFKQENKLDRFKQLQFLMKRLNAGTRWVKGHAGDPNNERCDKLANMARKNIQEGLDKTVPKGDSRIGTKKNSVVSLWYGDKLKIIDFENGIIEDYDRDVHGKRGSVIEIREGKDR